MTRADTTALADAIELLRYHHAPHECEAPAVCASCRTVSGLRRVLDSVARPGSSRDHAALYGPMFDARRAHATQILSLTA